jgi:alpha-1,3-rhamnosyl/mannosyltransferase
VASRVDRLLSPSDALRDGLYRRATVFVHPSRYEGFGLPLLEAMAHGVAVIAAGAPAAREVGGDAARFVASDASDDELAGAIGDLLRDDSARLDLARRGSVRAAGYTWERTAGEMLALYHRAIGRFR